MSYRRCKTLAVLGVAAVMGGSAGAQNAPRDVSTMTNAADLVIQGRVTKVDYKMSQAGPNGRATPFTFVTYSISQVVRGDPLRRSVTLRFIGGADGRGQFLQVSNVPRFQVGDEDILFIDGNGDSNCPLVACIHGRFRLHREAVHDGFGSPVRAVKGNRIVSGGMPPAALLRFRYPAPDFDELIKNPAAQEAIRRQGLTIEQARERHRATAPSHIEMNVEVSRRDRQPDSPGDGGSETTPEQAQSQSPPMQASAFLAAIGSAAESASATQPVQNADVSRPISAPSVSPVAPPRAPPQSNAPARSPADIAEEAGLPKDDPMPRSKAQ